MLNVLLIACYPFYILSWIISYKWCQDFFQSSGFVLWTNWMYLNDRFIHKAICGWENWQKQDWTCYLGVRGGELSRLTTLVICGCLWAHVVLRTNNTLLHVCYNVHGMNSLERCGFMLLYMSQRKNILDFTHSGRKLSHDGKI